MKRCIIDPEHSQVRISGSSSVHPIHAAATGLEGWLEVAEAPTATGGSSPLAGEVRIEVERLRSGNSLVDRETRRRIDASRFPEIVGTVESARQTGSDRFAVVGTVAFRGETHQVDGELTVSTRGDAIVIEGSQTFDVRDWGLEPPRLALLKVHPEVDVVIRLEARPEA